MQLSLIKQMEKFALEDPSVISLAQGTPFAQTDSYIREKVISALTLDLVDKYSDPAGIKELRLKISDDLKSQGMFYSSDEIIVTGGGIEALAVCMLTLLKPGDEIIFPVPCYAAYFKLAEVAGITVMPVPLREEAGWQLSSEDIINAISPKTKAILLCSPNNPTGTIFSQETLEEVSEAARRNGVYIFQDDIYGNMFYTEAPYNPLRSAENKKHIIRIVSFSKDFALTGWRVGYLHADVSLIPSLLSTHDSLLNCAPVISQ
jgi:aspartate/methionine/tyrosine aminotransferase